MRKFFFVFLTLIVSTNAHAMVDGSDVAGAALEARASESKLRKQIENTCAKGKIIGLKELSALLIENSNKDYCQSVSVEEGKSTSDLSGSSGPFLKVSIVGQRQALSYEDGVVSTTGLSNGMPNEIYLTEGRLCRLDIGENTTVAFSDVRNVAPLGLKSYIQGERQYLREAVFQFSVGIASKRLESAQSLASEHKSETRFSKAKGVSDFFNCQKPTSF